MLKFDEIAEIQETIDFMRTELDALEKQIEHYRAALGPRLVPSPPPTKEIDSEPASE